jgi:hypothetical protein
VKQESDYHDMGHLNHSMYTLFGLESDDARFDLDPTPKASGTHFRFTPSLLDPNSSPFAAFAAQPPGYYTPTPGGSTLGFQTYEIAANTPTYNTPDSLSHPNAMAVPSIFQPQLLNMDHSNYMHFRPHPYAQDCYQGLSVPGSAVGGAGSESSPSNYSPETASAAEFTDPELYLAREVHEKFMNPGITRNGELFGQFRFSTTLHASTAMLRHSSDIPVTYLNKRQAYTISIVDSSPAVQNTEVKRYRTTVRIAFDEEDQRRNAPACWRLWKDGRGTLESGGNPDRLRAIDFEPVETRAANDKKGNTETKLQVEESTTSFDRFTVTWSSTSSSPAVYFCVRFLFLSTDFSHSKGVKGVPVRLVAKTEYLGTNESAFQNAAASELAYCKIKLFRDKGAERKLANDRQHLERAIEKLRQQAQQLTMGNSETAQQISNKKKKRHSFGGASVSESQPMSPQRRHRRDWSISSNSSTSPNTGNPRSQQDEAQRKSDKAIAMESMYASIRAVSFFSLLGDPADDPSLPFPPIAPQSQWEAPGIPFANGEKLNSGTVQRSSPALSQASFSSVTSEKLPYSGSPLVHPLSPSDAGVRMVGMMPPSQLSQKVHVQAATKDIDAMDVDPFYVPIPHTTPRPGTAPPHTLLILALCVYVAPAKIGPNGDPHTMHRPTAIDSSNEIYFAVYVPARTANALSTAISTKMGIDPNSIIRSTIINKRGLRLALDDEVVREMLDKQDMHVAVREIEYQTEQASNIGIEKRSSGLELFLAF